MQNDCGKVLVGQVRSRRELELALELVHDNYVRSGYMEPDPSGFRLSIYYALPTTRTLVAVVNDEVIATVSVFRDSPLGLPMDTVYAREIHPLRDEGRYIGEVGMLADRRRLFSRSLPTLLLMMGRLLHTGRELGLSDLVITVNPRHKKFYTKFLCFEDYGPKKSCQTVNGAPAVLLRLDMISLKPAHIQRPDVRQVIFGPPPDGTAFQGNYHMHAEDLKYFFLEKTDILRKAKGEVLAVLEGQYPGLRLTELRQTVLQGTALPPDPGQPWVDEEGR